MSAEPLPAAIAAAGRAAGSGPWAGRAWAGLCTLTASVHLVSLYLARDLRAHLPAQLGVWLLAGLVWLLGLGVLRRATPLWPGSAAERRALLLLWAVALLMRLPAVALPVGHSDDVYRYLWDGAVQQAGLSPYAGAPDDPVYAVVRAAHPALHSRINHRHLPTIYPPAAQLAFRAHAALAARLFPSPSAGRLPRPLAPMTVEGGGEGRLELASASARADAAVPSPSLSGERESGRVPEVDGDQRWVSPATTAAADDPAGLAHFGPGVQTPAALAAAVRLWKALVVVADLLVLAVLVALCRALGRDVRWAAVWGAAPLPAMELAYNGHLESLGVLPLVLALWLWQRAGGREPKQQQQQQQPAIAPVATAAGGPTRGQLMRMGVFGALMAAAVLVKPVAGAVLPALWRGPRRVLLAVAGGALLTALLLVVPYGRSGALPPSLGEYGRRWRSNEGAYAGLQVVTQAAVDRLYRPPYYEPWRWPRLARALTGRDRDTVWPDELAGALARGSILLALGALTVLGVRRRLAPLQLGLLLLLGYQLLTPVLHPWYELWPLALAALWPPLLPPIVLMAALAPLAHLPLADYLAGRGFHEAVWPRLVEHGAGWAALLWMLLQRRRKSGASLVEDPAQRTMPRPDR